MLELGRVGSELMLRLYLCASKHNNGVGSGFAVEIGLTMKYLLHAIVPCLVLRTNPQVIIVLRSIDAFKVLQCDNEAEGYSMARFPLSEQWQRSTATTYEAQSWKADTRHCPEQIKL
jgi:hypothetical protein